MRLQSQQMFVDPLVERLPEARIAPRQRLAAGRETQARRFFANVGGPHRRAVEPRLDLVARSGGSPGTAERGRTRRAQQGRARRAAGAPRLRSLAAPA